MAWQTAAITAGVTMLGSILGNSAQKGAAKAQRIVDRANAEAANRVRGANNKLAAKQASLSNLTRSLHNQGKMRAGGEALNALNTNLVRLQDQMATGSLNQQITAAEQLGAIKAQAAASGAGGTSAAMLHQTMQLSHARAETSRNQQAQYQTYDMLAQRAGIVSNMALSLDLGQDFAPIDHSTAQAPFRAGPQGNVLLSFLQNGGAQLIGQVAGAAFTPAAAPAASSAQAFPVDTSSSIQQFLLK